MRWIGVPVGGGEAPFQIGTVGQGDRQPGRGELLRSLAVDCAQYVVLEPAELDGVQQVVRNVVVQGQLQVEILVVNLRGAAGRVEVDIGRVRSEVAELPVWILKPVEQDPGSVSGNRPAVRASYGLVPEHCYITEIDCPKMSIFDFVLPAGFRISN